MHNKVRGNRSIFQCEKIHEKIILTIRVVQNKNRPTLEIKQNSTEQGHEKDTNNLEQDRKKFGTALNGDRKTSEVSSDLNYVYVRFLCKRNQVLHLST